MKNAKTAILNLLGKSNAPLLRRFIECSVCVKYGFSPAAVTRALRELTRSSAIIRTVHSVSYDTDYHLYSLHNPKMLEKIGSEDSLSQVEALLKRNLLRVAGEKYARAILLASKLFNRISQARYLGKVEVGRVGPFDLKATLTILPKPIFVIEVKNQRETFYPHIKFFGSFLLKACRANAIPLLIVSHVSRSALTLCDHLGIVVIHLQRQILPKHLRCKIEKLRYFLGPQQYEYIEVDRLFHRDISPAVSADIDALNDARRITGAYETWCANRRLIYDELLKRDGKIPLWEIDLLMRKNSTF